MSSTRRKLCLAALVGAGLVLGTPMVRAQVRSMGFAATPASTPSVTKAQNAFVALLLPPAGTPLSGPPIASPSTTPPAASGNASIASFPPGPPFPIGSPDRPPATPVRPGRPPGRPF